MEFGRVVVWWALYQGLLLAGWPLASAIVPESRNRGAWMAIPLSLVVLVLPVFWLGHWAFGLLTVLAGVAVLVVLSAATMRLTGFEPEWRAVAEIGLVFTVAFVFLVFVQAAAAGIYPGGGEKFLDFGLLQSLLRSTRLPPEDMWFAGERMVYYYGGHLVAATLAKLTATPGRFAYSLALAGFYAMEVTAVYGLASSIAADRSLPSMLAGGFAAVLWGFASNLLTPARLAANLLPTGIMADVARALSSQSGGVYYIDPNHVAITPSTFSYWTASRVIPQTINEFPLFAYRNGDLHAHMMSVALMLTAVGVLYGYYRTDADRRWRRWSLLLGVLPPIVGVILFVNTWSFPTVLGVTVLTIAAAPADPATLLPGRVAAILSAGDTNAGRIRDEVQRPLLAVVLAVVIGAIGVLWVLPFVGNVLLASAGERGIGVWPTRSGIGPFVLVHGAFLAILGLYTGSRLTGGSRQTAALVAFVPIAAVVAWKLNLVGLLLVGPLVVVGWYLLRTELVGYEGVLLVAGAGLVVLVEFVFLADNAGPGRFNTVFKTYMQVWTFWALASGVGLAALVRRAPSTLPIEPGTRTMLGQAFAAALLVSVSLYGGMAMAHHFGSADSMTLDGYAYLHDQHPDEAGAIEWLATLDGQPTIVSAPGHTTYTWENPASSLTGIPTVAGWAHEAIYRGSDAYQGRSRDVEILFETTDPRSRAALLDRYDVQYIYYGPRERDRYGNHDYAAEPGISVAYDAPDQNVTIFRVDRSKLEG